MALSQPASPPSPHPDPSVSVLQDLVERVRPVSLAGERRLPVLPALEPLLPGGGLRRGWTVAVSGSTSLTLALVAEASAAGSWCSAVGLPALGLAAAAELGVVLERFPLVPAPAPAPAAGGGAARRGGWDRVVAALVDACDVVVASSPPPGLGPRVLSRLAARARERGAVLLVAAPPGAGARWWPAPAPPDLRVTLVRGTWQGLSRGHGYLRARRVEVVAEGRATAGCSRRAGLWLPAPGGGLRAADAG